MYTVKLKFKSVYISNVDENEITPLLDILFFFDENSEYGNKAFSIYPNTTKVLEIPIKDKEAYERDVEIGYLKTIPCKQDTIFMPLYSDYGIYKDDLIPITKSMIEDNMYQVVYVRSKRNE